MTEAPTMMKDEILSAVAEGTMTPEDASVLLARMVPERPLTLKVSEKGAVTVYGLQRWPVTHYADQWLRLLEYSDKIKQFIEDNRDKLADKSKPQKE